MTDKRRAFSLIELMVSIMILMVALPALLLGVINYFALNETTKNVIIATEEARRVIEEMRELSGSSLTGITSKGNWTAWAAATTLDNWPPPPEQQAYVLVTYPDHDFDGDTIDDNPLAVTVEVNWQEGGRACNLSLSTLITER